MEGFTVEDYLSIFDDMRRDAQYYLDKGKASMYTEMATAAQSALELCNEAEKETDLFELETYYNEIRAQLRICEDEND